MNLSGRPGAPREAADGLLMLPPMKRAASRPSRSTSLAHMFTLELQERRHSSCPEGSLAKSKANLSPRVGFPLLRLQLLRTHDADTSQHVLAPRTEPLVNSLRTNLFMMAVI